MLRLSDSGGPSVSSVCLNECQAAGPGLLFAAMDIASQLQETQKLLKYHVPAVQICTHEQSCLFQDDEMEFMRREFTGYKRDTMVNAENSRTGKGLPSSWINSTLAKSQAKDAEVAKVCHLLSPLVSTLTHVTRFMDTHMSLTSAATHFSSVCY
jgi:hypothetical protein